MRQSKRVFAVGNRSPVLYGICGYEVHECDVAYQLSFHQSRFLMG